MKLVYWLNIHPNEKRYYGIGEHRRSIVENIEGEFKKSSRSDKQKLDKFCVTKWAISTKCFKKFLDNYEASLELWDQSLKKNLIFTQNQELVAAKTK